MKQAIHALSDDTIFIRAQLVLRNSHLIPAERLSYAFPERLASILGTGLVLQRSSRLPVMG